MLLRAFVEQGDAGVICPRLQYIMCIGEIDVSLQTLRRFLNGKHRDIVLPDVLPWKRVTIDIQNIKAKETWRQMLDFVSQKKAEGLDVKAVLNNKTALRYQKEFNDGIFY